ncbi:hypothetical protein HRG_009907 [Hirsutella rhossiliensis]|uniref:Zn(2)-C6 fungal-type domain-containing protein n=1 Tax=Hirsutella rhossiliensis TaxID=111463 RepID=A0A9P8MP56_9HYPO|nr:uncharacterized protein HRG_09907 [Hirsutella rhossiliensis]KAH0958862.1 hypothetical protein HRG_09907 [Hirsutella rhossiliensis]
MAHIAPDYDIHKRKRDVEDGGPQYHLPLSTTSHQGGAGFINYLPRTSAERLGLLQGDADTFSDIIGVLERHESLAASLGAKLTGPRLLKGIEKFFDGPIRTSSSQPYVTAISWLDIVAFAKANPNSFMLTTMADGTRCCHFVCKGVRTEISEDDWRLISSGAFDRFQLERPFEEDETAELATLDILEQRASILYKKADEVAARARILHHKLGHRRGDLARRRRTQEGGGARFHAVNQPARPPGFGSSYDLHADLLQQYMAAPQTTCVPPSRSTSGAGMSVASLGPLSPARTSPHRQQLHRLSPQGAAADVGGEAYRVLITQSTDKLAKGDMIHPPCDRCRRLRLQCTKHLTACQGCTKKHAKCSWRFLTDDEIAWLRSEAGAEGETTEGEQEGGGGGTDFREAPVARAAAGGEATSSSGATMNVAEGASRPASRAGPELGGRPAMRSPDPFSAVKSEANQETRRSQLPLGQEGPAPTREQSRSSRISSLITETG